MIDMDKIMKKQAKIGVFVVKQLSGERGECTTGEKKNGKPAPLECAEGHEKFTKKVLATLR